MFSYPPDKVTKHLRRCKKVTLIGWPNNIYKVIFWDEKLQPFYVEMKQEFPSHTDFGNPRPRAAIEYRDDDLTQTLSKKDALQKLIACQYPENDQPEVDTYSFVKDLLKR